MNWLFIFIIFAGGGYHMMSLKKGEACERKLMEQTRNEELKAEKERQISLSSKRPTTLKFSYNVLRVLRELTQDMNEQTRLASLELLWRMQDGQSPTTIRKMFENETDPMVKMGMIGILAKDKSKLSLSLIALGLNDYDKDVRLKAIKAIGSFTCKEAIPALAPAGQDEDAEVRQKAVEAANLIRQSLQTDKAQALNLTDLNPIYRLE